MDRRQTIKSLFLGTIGGTLALHGCLPSVDKEAVEALDQKVEAFFGRTDKEKELIDQLNSETFFTEQEMETLRVLTNLILPPNDQFGGAVDAGVPEFIEFMAKDIPKFQTLLRGGLMWLDHKSNIRFNLEFKSVQEAQQKEILDMVAYYDPEIDIKEQALEIRFFSIVRNLTVTGYYTSKIGIEELGYAGNTPNVWDGVPEEVLKKHGLAYEDEWLAKCVDQSKRADIADWDEDGNLIT